MFASSEVRVLPASPVSFIAVVAAPPTAVWIRIVESTVPAVASSALARNQATASFVPSVSVSTLKTT